jgi:hypothetical protein
MVQTNLPPAHRTGILQYIKLQGTFVFDASEGAGRYGKDKERDIILLCQALDIRNVVLF